MLVKVTAKSSVDLICSLIIAYFAFAWTFNFQILKLASAAGLMRWAAVCLCVVPFLVYLLRPPTNWGLPVWAFILALGASIPLAENPMRSSIEYARVLSAFLVFLAASKMPSSARFSTFQAILVIFVAIIASSVAASVLKLPAAYAEGDVVGKFIAPRLIGTTWHPGILGYTAAISICGAMWWQSISRQPLAAACLTLPVVAMSLYCLVRGDSRTGEVAAILTIPLGLFLPRLERLCASGNRVMLKGAAGVLILAMFMTPVAIGFLGGAQIGPTQQQKDGFRSASLNTRQQIWHDMTDAFDTHPITGTGFGANGPKEKDFDPTVGYVVVKQLPFYHSLLVNCLATSGILGFLAGLWVLISGAWSAIDRLAEQQPARGRSDPMGFANVRASVLILAASYPFAAAEGALQGDYASYVLWFLALATLYAPLPASTVAAVQNAPRRTSSARRPTRSRRPASHPEPAALEPSPDRAEPNLREPGIGGHAFD